MGVDPSDVGLKHVGEWVFPTSSFRGHPFFVLNNIPPSGGAAVYVPTRRPQGVLVAASFCQL